LKASRIEVWTSGVGVPLLRLLRLSADGDFRPRHEQGDVALVDVARGVLAVESLDRNAAMGDPVVESAQLGHPLANVLLERLRRLDPVKDDLQGFLHGSLCW
jgi:hypothetical protein